MSIFARLGTLVAGIAVAACGSSLNESTTTYSQFDLSPGSKLLSIGGSDGAGDSAGLGPCVPAGRPTGGKNVYTRIDLEPDGTGWIGRSISSSDGNLVLTLRSVGPTIGRHTVTGTITGAATSVIGTPVSAPSKERIVFDSLSPGTVDGDGESIGLFVNGNVVARNTFTDTTGTSAACTWVVWSLQPLQE